MRLLHPSSTSTCIVFWLFLFAVSSFIELKHECADSLFLSLSLLLLLCSYFYSLINNSTIIQISIHSGKKCQIIATHHHHQQHHLSSLTSSWLSSLLLLRFNLFVRFRVVEEQHMRRIISTTNNARMQGQHRILRKFVLYLLMLYDDALTKDDNNNNDNEIRADNCWEGRWG